MSQDPPGNLSTNSRGRRLRVCLALCCALVFAACSSTPPNTDPAASSVAAPARTPLGTGGATPRHIDWRPCAGQFVCATVSVPLDYRKPGGTHINLAVTMLPAKDRARVIGPLFVNFGGPGTPGLSHLRTQALKYPAVLRARFDLIAFDPRGIGASTGSGCTEGADAPRGAVGSSGFWASAGSVGRSCASSPLRDHLSSANTARDMDMIRQDAGTQKINYIGYSYGSYLGGVYANLFPSHVRAMTFDGTLDLVANSTGRSGQQDKPVDVRADVASAQQAQIEQFLNTCAAVKQACPFAAGADPHRKWADLVAATKQRGGIAPLFEPIFRDLERGAPSWQYLAATLESAYQSANPAGASAGGQRPTKDPYVPTHSAGFLAVQCVDSDTPQNRSAYEAIAGSEDKRSPNFGLSAVYDMAQCVGWPGKDPDRYSGPWNAPLDAPVLIVNNRYDPATPLANAEATAKELSRADVLVVNSSGHTSLNVHSACAANNMANYFVTLTPPPRGTTCPADYQPFH